MNSSDGQNIGPQHGAFILGIYLNIFLYGVVVAGYYHYALHSKEDARLLRLFILFLFLADTLHTGLAVVYVYDALVVHFGSLSYLQDPTTVTASVRVISGVIAFLVHLFFAYRVKAISRRTWLSVIICLLATASLLFVIASVIAVRWPGLGGPMALRLPAVKGLLSSWLAAGVLADILIAVSLVWHLRRRKSGFPSTDSLINRIILLTVQTGVITTTWAIMDLAFYLASEGTDIHLFFNFSLAKWYTIFLMSSLNNRGSWEPDHAKTSALSWKMGSIPAIAVGSGSSSTDEPLV